MRNGDAPSQHQRFIGGLLQVSAAANGHAARLVSARLDRVSGELVGQAHCGGSHGNLWRWGAESPPMTCQSRTRRMHMFFMFMIQFDA